MLQIPVPYTGPVENSSRVCLREYSSGEIGVPPSAPKHLHRSFQFALWRILQTKRLPHGHVPSNKSIFRLRFCYRLLFQWSSSGFQKMPHQKRGGSRVGSKKCGLRIYVRARLEWWEMQRCRRYSATILSSKPKWRSKNYARR